eukprot:6480199-Amphidinium_carterae.1
MSREGNVRGRSDCLLLGVLLKCSPDTFSCDLSNLVASESTAGLHSNGVSYGLTSYMSQPVDKLSYTSQVTKLATKIEHNTAGYKGSHARRGGHEPSSVWEELRRSVNPLGL